MPASYALGLHWQHAVGAGAIAGSGGTAIGGGVVAAPGLALGWGVGGLDLGTGAGVCGLGVMARPRFASYCTNCWGFAKAVPNTTRFSLSHVARLAITNFW